MTIESRVLWLKSAAFLLLIGPGLIMVAGLVTPLMSWVEAFLDLAYQPFDGGQRVDGEAARLPNAILGGILVGFGTLIWRVGELVFRPEPKPGASLLVPAILLWFLIDSLGSVLAGASFNAVLNVVIAVVLPFPLLWKRQDFKAAA